MSLNNCYEIINKLSLVPLKHQIIIELQTLSQEELKQWTMYQFYHCIELQKASHSSAIEQLVILITASARYKSRQGISLVDIDREEVEELMKKIFIKMGEKYQRILIERKWIEEAKVLKYKEGTVQKLWNGFKDWFN